MLYGGAQTIRIIKIPDGANDVSDWLDGDPTRADKLVYICVDTPTWEPETAPPDAQMAPVAREMAHQDRRCAFCGGMPDGTEQECSVAGAPLVWLHRRCQRAALEAPGDQINEQAVPEKVGTGRIRSQGATPRSAAAADLHRHVKLG